MPRSPMPGEDFENPESNPPGPRAGEKTEAMALRVGVGGLPERFSESPGSLAKIPDQKTPILCIFFST